MLEYDILMTKVDLCQMVFNVLKRGRRFHGSIPRVEREVAWADALTRSVVCSHLSDHPEHPYGHVIEKERPPPLASRPFSPSSRAMVGLWMQQTSVRDASPPLRFSV